MMDHKIPDELQNSVIEYCIDEYVRSVTHRNMLRDKWFNGMTIDAIAEKYGITTTAVKNIIYDKGDRILVLASEMQKADGQAITAWRRFIGFFRKLS